MSGLEGSAKKLTAFVGETEQYEDRPLWQALVEQARIQGCAGATAVRGVLGYGQASRAVAKHGPRLSMDLPMIVSVVDDVVRITALAEVWSAMVASGLITVEGVQVVLYTGEPRTEGGDGRSGLGAPPASA
jgi:PII-like signaling protein